MGKTEKTDDRVISYAYNESELKTYKEVFLMKRVYILFFILCIFITGCSNKDEYSNWVKVDVPDVGTLKIPSEWRFEVQGDYCMLTDKESDDIKFIGYNTQDFNMKRDIQFNINNYEVYLENRDDSDFGEVYGGLSTGVIYGKKPITINGIEKEQYFIYMGTGSHDKDMELISVNKDEFDDEFIEKMAKGMNEP